MSYHVYIVKLKNDKRATMLTDQCDTVDKAREAAIERFGIKRVAAVYERSTTCADIGPENNNDNL